MQKPIKKTKQTEPIKVWYEHLSINHNWCRVDICIDYSNMNVSLVNNDRTPKEYIFCNRSLSYEDWWYNILEAIKDAMKIWFDKLRIRQEEKEKNKLEFLLELAKETDERKEI